MVMVQVGKSSSLEKEPRLLNVHAVVIGESSGIHWQLTLRAVLSGNVAILLSANAVDEQVVIAKAAIVISIGGNILDITALPTVNV